MGPEGLARGEKISVCHVASGDRWAGAESQLATLLRVLVRRPDLLLRVILLNEGQLAEEVRNCGIEVKVIPEKESGFFQIFKEAARYVRGRGIHVLHSHRYKENLLAALLAWRCHVPIVVRSQHGLPEPFGGLTSLKENLSRRVDRLVARYATDRVISVSAELHHHLVQYFRTPKVDVIPNGLDTERVRSSLSSTEAKRRLGIPGDCLVVGTAARLEPVKRLHLFLASAGVIAARLPNSRFVIAGEGREGARLREMALMNGLADRVLFLGHRSDIYDVLRAFDVFVVCSDHEGLPMVLLEALYLGGAVVARRVGGIPEVIQHGANGMLVESSEPVALAEACLSVLSDDELRRRLELAGAHTVAEKFTSEKTAEKVANLYFSLFGTR